MLGSPVHALYYALEVDREPREDTRQAACGDPEAALNYADLVDGEPREDTRQAACRSPRYAVEYAIHVDGRPLAQTREAARLESVAWQRYQEFERRVSSRDEERRPESGPERP